jgi:folate-binding protein YgfZ
MSSTPKLFALPHWTRLAITGADRQNFINNFCTNNVRKLEPGQGCEAFITNVKGHALGHGWFWALENELLYDTVPGQGGALVAHWDRYIIREKVELEDRTESTAFWCLTGETAAQALAKFGEFPAQAPRIGSLTIAGSPVLAARVSWLPEPTWTLSCDAKVKPLIEDSLVASGVVLASKTEWNTARIAARLPLFAQDISDENLPQELARDKLAISFTKGCYLGQETIARLDALGQVTKLFVGLRPVEALTTEPPLPLELSTAGKVVGKVTSFSPLAPPEANLPQALGFVRRVLAKPGTIVESSTGKFVVV